jgi:ABC-type dipeptide/oligopeptide/nickel transport system ATPase component
MLEKIIFINDNEAKIQITSNETISRDLVNLHLVFDDGIRKVLGEIIQVDGDIINIQFLGEFKDNNFIPGTIEKPKLNATVRAISEDEEKIILGTNDPKSFPLGESVLYKKPVNINVDALLNSHIAIFGNTGSGKSYGVATLLQSIYYNPNNIALNSTILIFDAHGEYATAFKGMNTVNPHYNFKLYSKDQNIDGSHIISLPIWLLDIEDIACLLGATEYSQLAIIEKALYVLSILCQKDNLSYRYKNHIIAKSIQTLMYSNLTSAEIRSQIFEILTICSTNELNLDVDVPGIGYKRQFRKCFDINKGGTFAEHLLVGEYIEQFISSELDKQVVKSIGKCNLKDLEDALNFVIISENVLSNEMLYNNAMMLKMRLHSLVVGGYGKYFEYPNYVNREEYIADLITENNQIRTQIVDIDIEGLDDQFTLFITRTYSKIMFDFVTNLRNRASIPIHIFLEEAHRFIKENYYNVFGNDVFQSIAKEGRKFGLILTLISQRPTELSETVLSQCSSFLLFRTNHPRDLEYMRKAIPNINTDIIDKQRSIQPGYFVGLGRAFKIPMIIRLNAPNPAPKSSNANVFDIWSGRTNKQTEEKDLD